MLSPMCFARHLGLAQVTSEVVLRANLQVFRSHGAMWCGVVWCGAVQCGAVRCGVHCLFLKVSPELPLYFKGAPSTILPAGFSIQVSEGSKFLDSEMPLRMHLEMHLRKCRCSRFLLMVVLAGAAIRCPRGF